MGGRWPFWRRGGVTPPAPLVDLRGKLPTRPGSAPYGTRPLAGIVGVDIHYTASSPAATVEAIATYQVGPNAQEDFPAIAYTMMVDQHGNAYLCHDIATRTWHNGAPAANTTRVGVCWIGNTSPNEVQIHGLAFCVNWLTVELGRALEVRGHKDAPYPTTCPGSTWNLWKPDLMDAI